MSDYIQDPYAGANSDEEREAIYQNLLIERRKTIYSDFMPNWRQQREIQQDIDQRCHKALLTVAAGSFGISFAFISQLVDLNKAAHMPLLIISWVSFAITIILTILELKIGSVI
jgi:uncharacterized membrane protein